MSTDLQKKLDRKVWLEKRSKIDRKRRQIASNAAYQTLYPLTKKYPLVLSYASFGTECDLWQLNKKLANEKKLVLPKVDQKTLSLFQVVDIKTLRPNHFGILEPEETCQNVKPKDILLAFIPGIAFDQQNHRLGFGHGFYDRLLSQFSKKTHTIGVGFIEQQTSLLPKASWDQSLTKVEFF